MEDKSTDPLVHAKNFIDRFGKHVNYQNKEMEEEKKRQAEKRLLEIEEQKINEKKQKDLKNKESEIRMIGEEEHGLRIKELMEMEKNILQQRSFGLK